MARPLTALNHRHRLADMALLNIIPWHTPELWLAVNEAICRPLTAEPEALASAAATARRIDQSIAVLDARMAELCAAACPACRDVCCRRAKVWYDFKDLLFIHFSSRFSDRPLPPAQPLSHPGERCRYLGASGCVLPRFSRPFICLWYLCPRQTASLPGGVKDEIDHHLTMIKNDRRLLEDQFVAGIT